MVYPFDPILNALGIGASWDGDGGAWRKLSSLYCNSFSSNDFPTSDVFSVDILSRSGGGVNAALLDGVEAGIDIAAAPPVRGDALNCATLPCLVRLW